MAQPEPPPPPHGRRRPAVSNTQSTPRKYHLEFTVHSEPAATFAWQFLEPVLELSDKHEQSQRSQSPCCPNPAKEDAMSPIVEGARGRHRPTPLLPISRSWHAIVEGNAAGGGRGTFSSRPTPNPADTPPGLRWERLHIQTRR